MIATIYQRCASKTVLKPEITWTKEEDEESLGNSRALNALFTGWTKCIETHKYIYLGWMNCSGCYQHLSYLLRIKASKRVVESHFKECVKTLKTSMKSPTDENLVQAVALLSQRFTKFKNKFYKKLRGNGTQANGDSNNSNFSSSDTYLQSGRLEESVDNEPKFSPSDFEELKVCSEYETLVKSVRMLSFGTQRLDNILIIQKNDLKGLGYLRYQVSFKGKSLVFAGASEQQNLDNILDSSNLQTKRKKNEPRFSHGYTLLEFSSSSSTSKF
ncbi:hypothetical protein E5676_scaffold244G00330 [Cucumis melo var. makuwa]|uniref:Uncharacterized protein n=1 Tax=Cucumis melo var. makuwa TaxID=1194695 RepID=A0A5D3DU82_CUCMM|nr:hypothetical protein E5676_scaffold244G00330 [Cucumis melo var. makuwa]